MTHETPASSVQNLFPITAIKQMLHVSSKQDLENGSFEMKPQSKSWSNINWDADYGDAKIKELALEPVKPPDEDVDINR